MAEDIYIVTGASRGIGAALYRQLQAVEGHWVLGIARSNPEGFEPFLQLDLTQLSNNDAIVAWLEEHLPTAASVTLINNAGLVDPIGKVGTVDAESVERSVTLNVTAPIVLTNALLHRLQDVDVPKRVLNISSGAAQSVVAGWATYCATKAALDHFSRVVHLEQQSAPYPARIMSVAPGVIDTEMQTTIRASGREAFPGIQRFLDLKDNDELQTPEETARGLIEMVHDPSFGEQAVGRLHL